MAATETHSSQTWLRRNREEGRRTTKGREEATKGRDEDARRAIRGRDKDAGRAVRRTRALEGLRALEGEGGAVEDAAAEGNGIGIFNLVAYTDAEC